MSPTRRTTRPFLLLPLSPFVIFDWLCNALYKSKTLQNILMILGRNAEQDEVTCGIQEWQRWLSFFWSYLPLFFCCCFFKLISVRSVIGIPFGTFWWYLVEIRTKRDDMSLTRIITLPFLLLALSPLVIFESDNALILWLLCKSNTLWNILIILGNVVQGDMSHSRMTTLAFWIL